jgi:hypothetical protein
MPHADFQDHQVDVSNMIQQEIAYQQEFIQHYQSLQKKYANTAKARLINNIQIPFIHLATHPHQNPLIIMEKLSGQTVWYHAVSAIFSPLFESEAFRKWEATTHPTGKEIDTKISFLSKELPAKYIFNP